jgi:hypothetical protein
MDVLVSRRSKMLAIKTATLLLSTGAFLCTLGTDAGAQITAAPSVIPPIVLQGCAEKVKAHHGRLYANRHFLSGSETGDQVVGFDLSFVNTSPKIARIVIVRVGGTDFTKIGTFSPDAVIAWRIAAPPGSCEVKAVRFEDGTEWSDAARSSTTGDASVLSAPTSGAPAQP